MWKSPSVRYGLRLRRSRLPRMVIRVVRRSDARWLQNARHGRLPATFYGDSSSMRQRLHEMPVPNQPDPDHPRTPNAYHHPINLQQCDAYHSVNPQSVYIQNTFHCAFRPTPTRKNPARPRPRPIKPGHAAATASRITPQKQNVPPATPGRKI